MTVQTGKTLLLKVGNGDGPPETFTSVAGLRAKQIQLNAQTVDVTNADTSGGWRELLAEAGVRSVSISGNGIFVDAASDETVRGMFFNEALAQLADRGAGFRYASRRVSDHRARICRQL